MDHNITASFAPFEERMRQEGLPEIVIDNFRHYYSELVSGSVGLIPEAEIEPVPSVPTMDDVASYASLGRAGIQRTAVLKLNGGLGTTMGLDKAKSLLVARDGLTFLDIIARQNLSLGKRYNCYIPLVLMNSFHTDADSRAVLAQYPALQGDLPLSIMQHKVPKILQDTLAPAVWPAEPGFEWCPPGHGEVYIALATSGMLDMLLERGYEYIFISNVDNLGATLDPAILGYITHHRIPLLMEVALRTEADRKGGHIARLKENGQLILREVAQCPQADLAAFQDVRKHRYFNTNSLWVSLRELKRILERNNNVLKLPMIRNAKTVDPKDSRSPAVFQLETAMGAAIAVFPGAQVLHVPRERFVPVKTCADLLNLRSDNFALDADYCLRSNRQRTIGPLVIELDQRYYRLIDAFEQRFAYGAPSLVDCSRLSVEGDVAFGMGIVLRGAVQIVNRAPSQRYLPSETVLEETVADLTDRPFRPADTTGSVKAVGGAS